jgi:pyruvate formate lyase activating enzyme
MRIIGFRQESFQDWDLGLSSVIITPNCNYQCPACHAKKVLEEKQEYPEEEIITRILRKKNYINKIVISGGEPTLQIGLFSFARRLKEKGLLIKLDTNGSDFGILQELKEEGLIDYVAMDVKGPPQLYPNIIGRDFLDARDGYEKSIGIVSQFPDYEFRTTIVPVIRENGEIGFMTPEEIGQTAKLIYDCSSDKDSKYFLQRFIPRKNELIDSRLETFPETSADLLEKGRKEAIKYLLNTRIR